MAGQFTNLVAFGDSHSDVGNLATDFSFPSLENNTPSADQLYTLFVGHNDLGWLGKTDVSQPVSDIVQHITTLAAAGARTFVVPNLHPLGHMPYYSGSSREAVLNERSQAFNELLADRLSTLDDELGITIHQVDFHRLVYQAIESPSSFGLSNVTQQAYRNGVVAPAPDEYMYWDSNHFTTTFYRLLAERAAAMVPEPSSALLVLMAVIGAAVSGRRNREVRC